ncbi:CXXC-type zinc finger protein 1-like [Numida meleagris]|uniref:CXXC-type zinc finger protein 1-like n=1 Tax=Numida meleagris TaxID=8996 RepID=UPI000B3DFB68|nr:CXXC-type zinc finger protein 1-like [Numida meleagris]
MSPCPLVPQPGRPQRPPPFPHTHCACAAAILPSPPHTSTSSLGSGSRFLLSLSPSPPLPACSFTGSGSPLHPRFRPRAEGSGSGKRAAMDSEFSDAEVGAGGEENAPVYCVCRKPDINCFMIGCDHCNEWFHGDCINITEKMAKAIREWYCAQCRAKDPSLEIRYRHKKSREKEHDGAKGHDMEPGRAAKIKRSARMCGECEACRRPEDCGQCDFCRDMKKFGGPNKIRQKCRLRQCQLRARVSALSVCLACAWHVLSMFL